MKRTSEEDLPSHLNSFVKPAIAAIEPAASPSQHLLEHLLHAPANSCLAWKTLFLVYLAIYISIRKLV